jgi:D-lactate dehydrogenase (cytochrome)
MEMPMRKLIYPMSEKYQDYLRDESKMVGKAVSISFPENEAEIADVVTKMRDGNIEVTIQGGKTGIAGCAVPTRGHILNLSKMNRVKEFIKTDQGNALLRVEPGITLLELKKEIQKIKNDEELFWPPDPTESSATVGGIASCNAKGLCSYLYGETRNYIEGVSVLQSDGTMKEIKRGQMTVPFFGYQKDLLDVYLGGEGMFGVITDLTLKLQLKPKEIWGIMFFFQEEEDVCAFVDNLRQKDIHAKGASLAAAEYMDRATIGMIQAGREVMPKLKELPNIGVGSTAMVYVEIHGRDEAAIEEVAEKLIGMARKFNSDPDRAWAVSGNAEVEKLRTFRHAAVECVNIATENLMQVAPSTTRLGIDMKLDMELFQSVITRYQGDSTKEGLNVCIFGHIGDNHLYVNILPNNYEQYIKGQNLCEKWARQRGFEQGDVIMENGVGKIQKSMFKLVAPKDYIKAILIQKNTYDTKNMWNPGNMIDNE